MLNGITIIKNDTRNLLWRPVDPFETERKLHANKIQIKSLKSSTKGQFLCSQQTSQCGVFHDRCVSVGSSTAPGTSFT